MSRNLRALVTKNSMKERYRTAHTYLQKLKFLVDDVGVDFQLDRFYLNEKKLISKYNMIFLLFIASTFTARYFYLAHCQR